jgi:hypothetical protein
MSQRTTDRWTAARALALCVAALTGCPGTIDEEMFRASREGGSRTDATATEGGGGDLCPSGVTDVQRDLLVPKCATAGCHTTMDRVSGLDLESPNLGSRLIGVRASMTGSCANRSLVTINGATVEGVLLGKLTDPAVCGLRMPIGRGTVPLTTQEIACLAAYLRTLSSAPAMDGGAPAMDASAPAMDASAPHG